nr:hypothetical protein [Nanoarchaeum sp.]
MGLLNFFKKTDESLNGIAPQIINNITEPNILEILNNSFKFKKFEIYKLLNSCFNDKSKYGELKIILKNKDLLKNIKVVQVSEKEWENFQIERLSGEVVGIINVHIAALKLGNNLGKIEIPKHKWSCELYKDYKLFRIYKINSEYIFGTITMLGYYFVLNNKKLSYPFQKIPHLHIKPQVNNKNVC